MKTQKKTNKKTSIPNINVSTKADIKNVAVYANRLIRGIDNETASVRKVLESNNKRMDRVTESINNLSKVLNAVTNAAISNTDSKRVEKTPVKTLTTAVKPTKVATKTTSKVATKTVSKPAVKVPAKAVKAPAKVPAKKVAKVDQVADNRPPLKKVIDGILGHHSGAVKASVIYAEATSGGTHWSRQSLYNALKDTARYVKIGDANDTAYQVAGKSQEVTEDEADSVINKIETAAAVANVL